MGKIKRLTSLYEALATMRRENLQTTFDLVELIHKINDDEHIENPEPRPEEHGLDELTNSEVPMAIRLKWALISHGRLQRENEELKPKVAQLSTEIATLTKKYERLKEQNKKLQVLSTQLNSQEGRNEVSRMFRYIARLEEDVEAAKFRNNYLEQQLKEKLA